MQRLDFIRACHAGTDSFSALCRLFGISRKTGYKWLQRFDPSDLPSLSDRSRAPRSHSRTVPDEVVGHLTALRQKHPDWGPKKLQMWLLNHHVDFSEPFVRECLTEAFLKYGLPEVLRTDNGQPFAGTGRAELSRLAVWLIKRDIRPERIRKRHPEENGRHEQMHRSLKSALAQGNTFMTMEEQQRWLSD